VRLATYAWQDHYQAVILETDDTKLGKMVDDLHTTLFTRLAEISRLVIDIQELQAEVAAIGQALDRLRSYERERLGPRGSRNRED
jgi:hypothetical protein